MFFDPTRPNNEDANSIDNLKSQGPKADYSKDLPLSDKINQMKVTPEFGVRDEKLASKETKVESQDPRDSIDRR
jgi:hypothetical protein